LNNNHWVRCDDVDVAAAFGTLGVPMKTTVQVRADNGREYVTVYLATQSAVNPELKTAQLMAMLKDGSLQKADPEHPLLYALEGIKNRHAIGDSIKATERVILITRKGTKRCAYVKERAGPDTLGDADRFLGGWTP
jgi:hypothetical protein